MYGSWIVSFKCDFEDGHAWKYYLGDKASDWVSIDEQECTSSLIEQAKGIDRHLSTISGPNGTNKMFSWLKGEAGNAEDIDDEAISILLNHVVVSQSMSSLEVVMSVVDTHRTVEMRGLLPNQSPWFYTPPKNSSPLWKTLLSHYALAFPKMFFKYESDQTDDMKSGKICGVKNNYADKLRAHRQSCKMRVLEYKVVKQSCILQIRLDFQLEHYERGGFCNCIPIPGERIEHESDYPSEPIGVCSPEVVISSPVVEKALKDLTDVWQDKAYATLISGPSGSGKDKFALSIPYGSGHAGKGISKISLANGTSEEQERQMFGYQQADGTIVDGLLAKAEESALFVDEAHYPLDKPGLRASLLRTLEAKEYFPVNTSDVRNVEDVQWVFASSLPIKKDKRGYLKQVPPEDFWTRMSHLIRIEHPLDYRFFDGNRKTVQSKQEDVLKDMFKFVWWDRIENHFGIDPVEVLSKNNRKESPLEGKVANRLVHEHIKVLLDTNQIDGDEGISTKFVKQVIAIVKSKKLAKMSIRSFRNMVSRIFSKCVGAVTTGRIDWANSVEESEMVSIIKSIQEIASLKP